MYTHHICFVSFQQNGAIASCVIGFVVVVVVIMFYFKICLLIVSMLNHFVGERNLFQKSCLYWFQGYFIQVK